MKQIKAIIERNSDGEYSVYCVDEMFSGMGATAEAAKEDMLERCDTLSSRARLRDTDTQNGSMANTR